MGLIEAFKYPKVARYKRAIKNNSSDHQLHVKLAETYMNLYDEGGDENHKMEAIKVFEQAMELGSTDAIVFLSIGEYLEEKGDIEGAKKTFSDGINRFVSRVRNSPSYKEEHALNVVELYKKINKLASAGVEINGVREQLETIPKSLLYLLDDMSKK